MLCNYCQKVEIEKSPQDGKWYEKGTTYLHYFRCEKAPHKNKNKKVSVPADIKKTFENTEQELTHNAPGIITNRDIQADINNFYIEYKKDQMELKRLLSALGESLAKMSFEKASKL